MASDPYEVEQERIKKSRVAVIDQMERQLKVLEKHRHDAPSYDAYYIDGCDGCDWKPDRDSDEGSETVWRQFYIHIVKEMAEAEREVRDAD